MEPEGLLTHSLEPTTVPQMICILYA